MKRSVKCRQHIWIGNNNFSNPDMLTTLNETFSKMLDMDSEIVTIYIGEDGSEDLANELAQDITEKFEDVEVEIHNGGQPVYPYLFSVE